MKAETLRAAPGGEEPALTARLFAVDPVGLGGVVLRALPGPVRDRWIALLRGLLGPGAPLRRVPIGVGDDRLLGGLDLAATLETGRPVEERGILAEADGGVLLLAMSERMGAATAARLAQVLDAQEVRLERDGFSSRRSTRLGIVALDEGIDDEERTPAAMLERLAFRPSLAGLSLRDTGGWEGSPRELARARERLAGVALPGEVLEALVAAAFALGISSLRAPQLALRAARAAAALAGRERVEEADCSLAAGLVLAPRATRLPAPESGELPEPEAPAEPEAGLAPDGEGSGSLEDRLVASARSAIPSGLLEQLADGELRGRASGRSGGRAASALRGRPAGVRRGSVGGGARLSLVETLRAAAPWQGLRRRAAGAASGRRARIRVAREDFRVVRFRRRAEVTSIFVVDASGSTALHRLAEAKGAVELLLSDCYVRRDRVALIAFRGRSAELLLPPTRSLVRAKRSLGGLPGGGATPLASGIETATRLAEGLRRRGGSPLQVFLTDGQANVARDGTAGRAQAAEDALRAGRELRLLGLRALLVDTSPRPQMRARRLAEAMDAPYLPLPLADAHSLSGVVRDLGESPAPLRVGRS